MSDDRAESPELERFLEQGCNLIGPGIGPERAAEFAAAFAESRTCSAGHEYRGAFCVECERDKAGAARG